MRSLQFSFAYPARTAIPEWPEDGKWVCKAYSVVAAIRNDCAHNEQSRRNGDRGDRPSKAIQQVGGLWAETLVSASFWEFWGGEGFSVDIARLSPQVCVVGDDEAV